MHEKKGLIEERELINQLEWLRSQIIGRNISFATPFGWKPLVYADYTASGRNVRFIENYMLHLMQYYANTHTEDDFTGKTMTLLLQAAAKKIKKILNAGETGKVIFTESGTTGGITRLQQILGVYWPPATKRRVDEFLESCLQRYPDNDKCNRELREYIEKKKPIVFVGPYEHHSNEIMWRQTLCEVVEIPLSKTGDLDLIALEEAVANPCYASRQKIGSFSAASNVSGIRTPVYDVARILHRHDAIACFDFAACAPYIEIDMNRDHESYFDAIFLSPHKFLGGPGTSGLLVINEKIYPRDLPPCIAAGGTVDFVTPEREKFISDIEIREKPGTPGILQNIKIALIFQLKEQVGISNIEKIENFYLQDFYERFKNNRQIIFYGPTEPAKKVAIIPFNIIHKDRILHPKFVTRLMNDLFGIQTRAGCSCAGPYGHRLLNIDKQTSRYYQCLIALDNYSGLKPGWVRLNLHYTLSWEEYEYLVRVLDFMTRQAELFLPLYEFNLCSGEWYHRDAKKFRTPLDVDLGTALKLKDFTYQPPDNGSELYQKCLQEAEEIAANLQPAGKFASFEGMLEELMFFYVINYTKDQDK
ncbi:MAG: aminotransferase class V-fold PLP-dependent enzyme [Candidatus Cloacimonetes bacterium]|nr:aminotransferase class V-fold PLP-dependent enzyme [Candidatus Cloacimonadota bacterium]